MYLYIKNNIRITKYEYFIYSVSSLFSISTGILTQELSVNIIDRFWILIVDKWVSEKCHTFYGLAIMKFKFRFYSHLESSHR